MTESDVASVRPARIQRIDGERSDRAWHGQADAACSDLSGTSPLKVMSPEMSRAWTSLATYAVPDTVLVTVPSKRPTAAAAHAPPTVASPPLPYRCSPPRAPPAPLCR